MHARSTLGADLRALGLAAGEVVMLHASVRTVGEIAGYAGCPQYVDEAGRGNLSAEEEAKGMNGRWHVVRSFNHAVS